MILAKQMSFIKHQYDHVRKTSKNEIFSTASMKSQINKFLCKQDFCVDNFMLHFLIISHHNISLQCFSGQQKDAEKFCVR